MPIWTKRMRVMPRDIKKQIRKKAWNPKVFASPETTFDAEINISLA